LKAEKFAYVGKKRCTMGSGGLGKITGQGEWRRRVEKVSTSHLHTPRDMGRQKTGHGERQKKKKKKTTGEATGGSRTYREHQDIRQKTKKDSISIQTSCDVRKTTGKECKQVQRKCFTGNEGEQEAGLGHTGKPWNT